MAEWKCPVIGCRKVLHASRWSRLEQLKEEHIAAHKQGKVPITLNPVTQPVTSPSQQSRPTRPGAMLTTPFGSHGRKLLRKCKNCTDSVYELNSGTYHLAEAFGTFKKSTDQKVSECVCGCVKPE